MVNFYLKFIEKEVMSTDIQEKTLTLNSFFFDKLKRDKKHTGHINFDSVKTWNRGAKDLFMKKEFIFIPICENQHWLMACIVYPNKMKQLMDRQFKVLLELEKQEAEEKALRERRRTSGGSSGGD